MNLTMFHLIFNNLSTPVTTLTLFEFLICVISNMNFKVAFVNKDLENSNDCFLNVAFIQCLFSFFGGHVI